MKTATKNLIYSQIAIFLALLTCTIIDPSYLFSDNQGGVSNFGAQVTTIIPYSLGLLISSVFIILAANSMDKEKYKGILRGVLLVIAVLQLLVLVTTFTYKISEAWHGYHVLSTQVFFIGMLISGTWFAIKTRTQLAGIIYALFMFGFFAAVLTLFGVLHVLFVAEVVATFAFGGLMIYGTQHLLTNKQ